MLILTRREGQRIFVGDDIVITLMSANCNNIKIGIDAPNDVRIVREEIAGRDAPNPPPPRR